MKTFTINYKKKFYVQIWMLISSMFLVNSSLSQIQNNGIIGVGDKTSFCIATGNQVYGSSAAQITTSHSATNYGKLVYASASTWSGATSANFTNGYVQTLGTAQFIYPIGANGIFAPAAVIPTTATGVDAAYFNSNPSTVGSTLDASVGSISAVEYWSIKSSSAQAKISLTWRSSSNVATLTNSNLSKLVIAGWNGTAWIQIVSTVDTNSILASPSSNVGNGTTPSTLTTGSITTTGDVNLATFSAFTLAEKSSCNTLVASSGNTKTFGATGWTPSAPTLADPAIISIAYSGGTFACNSLALDADVTLSDGENIEIVNGTSGTGKIIMSSKASVAQRNGSSPAPAIVLTKQTRDMRKYDYVYFGSPISGNVFSQLDGAQALTGAAGAFDLKYKYVSGAGGGWQALTSTSNGSGFIMRVKPAAPFLTATAVDKINLTFTGTANNGDVTVNIAQNIALPNAGMSHNLLANPYPSAIDGDLFLRQNTSVDGVLYVWQQSTAAGDEFATTYAQADYLVYTKAGTVNPTAGLTAFNGKIASGQSFKVKAVTTGTATFTNCMRLTGDNNTFYRTNQNIAASSDAPIDSYKLVLKDGTNVYSEILVAYSPSYTSAYDRMYDAGRNSVSSTQLYSQLDTDGRKLAINARPEFAVNDIVKLGMSKENNVISQFSINIQEKKGVFNSGQVVYIHDKDLNIYHNTNLGSYSFSASNTEISNRFEVVYQASALGNQQYDNLFANAFLTKEILNVKSSEDMSSIEVYDITGKKIASYKVNNSTDFTSNFSHAEGIYIAKIKLTSGFIVNQKLINIK